MQHLLDPYQFAYSDGRGTDDALTSTTDFILKHLENPSVYARLMFMDFSSAFNTILPQIMLKKLKQMDVNPYLIRRYHSFLTERQQQVKVNSTLSDTQVIAQGPHKAALALLFSSHSTQMSVGVSTHTTTL